MEASPASQPALCTSSLLTHENKYVLLRGKQCGRMFTVTAAKTNIPHRGKHDRGLRFNLSRRRCINAAKTALRTDEPPRIECTFSLFRRQRSNGFSSLSTASVQ